MSLAQVAEIGKRARQIVSKPQPLKVFDELKLALRRAGTPALVGKLGIDSHRF